MNNNYYSLFYILYYVLNKKKFRIYFLYKNVKISIYSLVKQVKFPIDFRIEPIKVIIMTYSSVYIINNKLLLNYYIIIIFNIYYKIFKIKIFISIIHFYIKRL